MNNQKLIDLNGEVISHIVVALISRSEVPTSRIDYTYILNRTQEGHYNLLAKLYQSEIIDDILSVTQIFTQRHDIAVVNLGLLYQGKFLMEDIDPLFNKEQKEIVKACSNAV